jgi:hypothetical protein
MSIPMRWTWAAAAVAGLFWLNAPARADYLYGLVGNDTGGIIPYSPVAERHRRAIASDHCSRYDKYARITSVHRRYGDYIVFRCLFGAPRRPVVITLF